MNVLSESRASDDDRGSGASRSSRPRAIPPVATITFESDRA